MVFDHESIKWFTTQKDLRDHKAREIEILQEFDYQLRYHKGWYNAIANALSLSLMELRSDLLVSLQGKCELDQVYGPM